MMIHMSESGTNAEANALNPLRLGVDAYSLRSQSWSALEILDYCHYWGVQVVHFSEVRLLGGIEEAHLEQVKVHAGKLNLRIEIGMLSICPTSNLFDRSQGTAQEQLSRMIHAATIVGSPLVRVVLGNAADRRGALSIERHIENTVEVLRSVRSQALDAGVRIAVENHSGDMQGWELKTLIEQAGPEFVGACLDSGNPLITLDDPHLALEFLAPYVLTSHVRDTAVWLTDQGAAAAWVRMGAGNVRIDDFVRNYQRLCPSKALSLEVIVSPSPRELPFREPSFWDAYRKMPAWQFERFLEIAQTGRAPVFASRDTSGTSNAQRELEDFASSMKYTLTLLGLPLPAEEFRKKRA
jgi:3-oxoisoapionate decarboxylase